MCIYKPLLVCIIQEYYLKDGSFALALLHNNVIIITSLVSFTVAFQVLLVQPSLSMFQIVPRGLPGMKYVQS